MIQFPDLEKQIGFKMPPAHSSGAKLSGKSKQVYLTFMEDPAGDGESGAHTMPDKRG